MASRRKKVAFCAALFLLGALVIWPFTRREPSYQGKSLSAWLSEYEQSFPHNQEVDHAIGEMGSKALPHLMKMIRRKDSDLRQKVAKTLEQQSLVKIKFIPAEKWRRRAGWAIKALGEKAEPAMAGIFALLDDPETALASISAAGAFGFKRLPFLGRALTNQNGEIRRVASSSLLTLSVRPEATNYAAQILPLALRNLDDPEPTIRTDAAYSVARFAEVPVVVEALSANLLHTNEYVRAMTAQALGMLGPKGQAAVPVLRPLLNDPDKTVRDRAKEAIERISTLGNSQ